MVSTTILEFGETERIRERVSLAEFRSISTWVMTTSGLLRAMRARASSPPVEDCPTTSTSPSREVRMAAKPSLNMVWSSARCTRIAMPTLLSHEQSPCGVAHRDRSPNKQLSVHLYHAAKQEAQAVLGRGRNFQKNPS